MNKQLYIFLVLLTFLVSVGKVQAVTIYKCSYPGQPYTYTTSPPKNESKLKCVTFEYADGWIDLGSTGEIGERAFRSYKYFDEKRPATKVWVQYIYENQSNKIENTISLIEIKCSTKQVTTLQDTTRFRDGSSEHVSTPSKPFYVIPGSVAEKLLIVACEAPTK